MSMDGQASIGIPATRYEARAKVTGKPIYAADVPGVTAHAWLVTSAIARGRIVAIDARGAKGVAGVLEVYTHENAPHRHPVDFWARGGAISDTVIPLAGSEIHYGGQIIAMVVADTAEQAREAAGRIAVRYEAATASPLMTSAGAQTVPATIAVPTRKEKSVGDCDAAFAAASAKIDAIYSTPCQHHNAMELHSTTAAWDGDHLTIHEPTQAVYMLRRGLALQLGIPTDKITVINPFVGGAFGGKGILTPRTALVALAAKALGRCVRLVVTRAQSYATTSYRGETRHHVRLAADRDGTLTAYGHEVWEQTSRADVYIYGGIDHTAHLYACPNVDAKAHSVRVDRNTPGFMRSPPEYPCVFALETALDELALELKMDPVELRRKNDTTVSSVTGQVYTSRSLMPCFDAAAARFGWNGRNPAIGSMRDGDWLIGYGCATAAHPGGRNTSSCRVTLRADGTALVQVAGADVGQGAYSAIRAMAAEQLRIDPLNVAVEMGDTRLPPGPIAGGSRSTATIGSALLVASARIAAHFGNIMPTGRDLQAGFARLNKVSIEEIGDFAPPAASPQAMNALYSGHMGAGGGQLGDPEPLVFAFGAEFVEVRVHRRTREIRVPRMTGAFAAGHIVNPVTARNQLVGGMIWGMGSALLEATEIDSKRGRYTNDNIAEYLMATNADVPHVDVLMLPEKDGLANPLGIKGVGELGNVGTAAAISNAVYHATGRRIRDLPITLDKLL